MEEIQLIGISELSAHPKQIEIYGDEEPDEDFLTSVKEVGIITPLIISENGNSFTIVSGHRRFRHAKILGLKELPCIIRSYNSEEEMELHFLLSNQNREKNLRQKINEFLAYKQKLRQTRENRATSDFDKMENIKNDTLVTVVNELNIPFEKGVRMVDIIERATGFSKRYQEYSTVIFDRDYRDNKINSMSNLVLGSGVTFNREKFFMEWCGMEEEVLEGRKSLKTAHDEIKTILNAYETALKQLKEKKQKKEVKTEKIELEKPEKPEKPKKPKLEVKALHVKQIKEKEFNEFDSAKITVVDADRLYVNYDGLFIEINLLPLKRG